MGAFLIDLVRDSWPVARDSKVEITGFRITAFRELRPPHGWRVNFAMKSWAILVAKIAGFAF